MKDIMIRNNDEAFLEKMLSIEDNYSFQIRHFVKFIRENQLPLNIETIRAYFIELNQSDYEASGKRVKRQAVKSRLKALAIGASIEDALKIDRWLKQLDDDPATKAPKIQSSKIDRTKCLSDEDFKKLIDGCRSDRQKRFIEFMYATGARVSEMLSIKLKNIKIEKDLARIKIMGKGRKERVIIIPVLMLEEIKSTFTGKIYLFATSTGHVYSRIYVTSQIKKIGKYILHRSISAHTLRHSFATRLIKETRKVQAVSNYLGHSSTSITMDLYCHEELSPEELFK